MKSMIIGMLAETPIHPGAGRSTGFVDLPVARESTTDYPVIGGSSLKGVLRDRAREKWHDVEGDDGKTNLIPRVAKAFGMQDNAGNLIVSDVRLLLLPVRSLTGQYKWVTCPYLLERMCRDFKRSGLEEKVKNLQISKPDNGLALAADKANWLFLEEREFKITGNADSSVTEAIRELMPHKEAADRLADQLVILNDDDFKWFASYGLSVNARNVLKEDTKTSENLWYEETLSPDSLFYTVFFERGNDAINLVKTLLKERPFLQVGGNETVGQGWFATAIMEGCDE